MAKVSKKMKASMDAVDRTKEYVLAEAAALVKQNAAGTKFDETIEIAMNLGVDPRHADQMVRGVWRFLPRMPRLMKQRQPVPIWWVPRIWLRPFRVVSQILTALLPRLT